MKKILLLLVIIIAITGCSSKEKEEDLVKYEKFTIKTELTNKESQDDAYLVYLMPVGLRDEEPGAANQSGYYGPFETDDNGEVEIDMKYNNDIAWYIKSEDNEKPRYLEVFVTTKEDVYIRNPLNKKTEIRFIDGDTEAFLPEFAYYSSIEEITIPFTDKYPDGVLSLTSQDATFVIKFEFEDGFKPTNSYETSIVWFDENATDGLGMYRSGSINRAFQYYELPFFKTDNLASKTGTIVVKHFDTGASIAYEGYPKRISFDANGKCIEGDIVTIKILKHD
jgi:hypothetical protein